MMIRYILLFWGFTAFLAQISAQNTKPNADNAVWYTVQTGINNYSTLENVLAGERDQTTPVSYKLFSFNTSPTYSAICSKFLRPDLSLGVMLCYDRMAMKFQQLEYYYGNTLLAGDGTLHLHRTSVHARQLYHYIQKKKVNMYTGLSVGIAWWSATGNGVFARQKDAKEFAGEIRLLNGNPDFFFTPTSFSYSPASPQIKRPGLYPQVAIVVTGVRISFTKSLGLVGEMIVNGPALFSIGLSYKS